MQCTGAAKPGVFKWTITRRGPVIAGVTLPVRDLPPQTATGRRSLLLLFAPARLFAELQADVCLIATANRKEQFFAGVCLLTVWKRRSSQNEK